MTGAGSAVRRVAIVVLACLVVAGGTGAATGRPGSVGGAQQTTRAGDAVDWRYTPLDPRAGETVTLIAPEGGGDRTYAWDLDADGQFEGDGRVITHAFPEAGDHEVSLRVAGADGATTTTRNLSVRGEGASTEEGTDGPSIRYTPLEPAPGERITVVAELAVPVEEVVAMEWTLGGVEKRGRIVTHRMPASGGLTISLTVERTDGTTRTASTTIGGAAATTASSTAVAQGTVAGTPTGSPGFGVEVALVAIALIATLRYWRGSDR